MVATSPIPPIRVAANCKAVAEVFCMDTIYCLVIMLPSLYTIDPVEVSFI